MLTRREVGWFRRWRRGWRWGWGWLQWVTKLKWIGELVEVDTNLLSARRGDLGVSFRVGGDILFVGTQEQNGRAEERKSGKHRRMKPEMNM